jgi:hypothetical protein
MVLIILALVMFLVAAALGLFPERNWGFAALALGAAFLTAAKLF